MVARMAGCAGALAGLFLGAMPAAADGIVSAYTKIDADTTCTTFAAASADDGGDWANMVCDGYRGYPVFLYYGDARESLFYGFAPGGDLAPAWESFDAFNSTGPTVEWRIETAGEHQIPFATIHRWFVSDPEGGDEQIEVLVVAKVGQPAEREGCAVGYVVATGNDNANEKARHIADNVVRDFVCDADQPTIEQGTVPVPSFNRTAN
ncbi:hypothetical protein ABGN05_10495 [Aquibium sp. LZ166]|uniref:Uncharacterized protein n=2 Tax=Aquibium pacificus TaxID=3153579 RepID=A0ABV3SH69_9HYPH